jgi:hypothetical protein
MSCICAHITPPARKMDHVDGAGPALRDDDDDDGEFSNSSESESVSESESETGSESESESEEELSPITLPTVIPLGKVQPAPGQRGLAIEIDSRAKGAVRRNIDLGSGDVQC